MTLIMASGDNHFRAGPRFEECQRVHAGIASEVRALEPDLFVLPGDLYHSDSTPDERTALVDFLVPVTEVCPVLIVPGNHGRQRDLRILTRLRTRHPIILEEGAAVHVVAGVAVGAVAWPERASVASMLGRPVPVETVDAAARELMREVFRRLGAEMAKHAGPRVLMGHFMVDGAMTDSAQPMRGAELALQLEDFELADAHAVVMAHVHRPQEWMLRGGAPAIYTGSPYRTDYGEPGVKSFLCLDVDERGVRSWWRVPTCARPMHLLRGRYAEGQLDVTLPEDIGGADVRVRYDVAEDERVAGEAAAAELRARLLAAGAADVKLEPVPEMLVRVRAPEVAAETSIEGKLRARWRLQGVPEERQARLLAKLATLTAETRAMM